MATSISYNSFSLQDSDWRTKDIIYRNFPEKVIDLEPNARRDGFRVINTYYNRKDISISGTLTKDPGANLKISLDSMKEALHAMAAPPIAARRQPPPRGRRSLRSTKAPEEHYHIT